MKRRRYHLLIGNGVLWIMLVSILLFPSCRSGPMDATEKAKEATRLVKEGTDDFNQGDIDSAMSKFEKALQLAPDWTKVRRDYAELLYRKAQGYDQYSNRAWQRTLGRQFDDATLTWRQSGEVISEEEKVRLQTDSDEAKRMAILYYRKALEQLQILDRMVGGDENAICAMAIIYVFLNEFEDAKACFERVLDSPRIEEKIREKIRNAIDAISEFQKKQVSPGR